MTSNELNISSENIAEVITDLDSHLEDGYSKDLKYEPSKVKQKAKWYEMEVKEVEKALDTSLIEGLTQSEATERLDKFGPNELKQGEKEPQWKVFLRSFTDPLMYILIIAAIISTIFGEFLDALVIIIIVILNAVISFVEEGKADKAIEALRHKTAPEANVIRDSSEKKIKAFKIVPGDIIVLGEGDRIPADGRIFEQSNFKSQEASLTGESLPIPKSVDPLNDHEVPLAERKNMVYASTLITYGRGKAIVTETGMNTEVGHIAEMILDAEEKMTPLQQKLAEFGNWLGKVILFVCFGIFVLYLIRPLLENDLTLQIFVDSLIAAIALAVAAIPEGLPAVVTICLAIGITRMAKQHAIIKKLRSVETLGCTTVICSDKTGTLTKNEMMVRAIWAGGKLYDVTGSGYSPDGEIKLNDKVINPKQIPDLEKTLLCGLLSNNARLYQDETNEKWDTFGDPTEGCLITSAWKARMDPELINKTCVRVDEIPFDSVRKRMTTINMVNGKRMAFVKGAIESLLDVSTSIQIGETIRPINQDDKEKIMNVYASKAAHALRGLGFAYRIADNLPVEMESVEKDLVFVGMQFAMDPPRTEVKQAIKKCKSAGIRVKMITGDNLITAKAIAEEIGMIEKHGIAKAGNDIPNMNDDEIEECDVYARVNPEQKQTIVKALQNKNHVVAMTGDGVNDAPALKNANIGIAMGITGTDVSKEAAAMILTDDNFATIVNAVEEGRGIYDNIKKFIQYLLSSNIMEVLLLAVSAVIAMMMSNSSTMIMPPLTAVMLLWINLVSDGAPALALAFDPYDPSLMEHDPRPVDEPFLTKRFLITMIYRGVILTIIILGFFYYTLEIDRERAQSVVFYLVVIAELANAINCRSEYNSIFKIGLFTNKTMVISLLFSFALTMILFIPGSPVGVAFGLVPLEPFEYLWGVLVFMLVILAVELLKIVFRKRMGI